MFMAEISHGESDESRDRSGEEDDVNNDPIQAACSAQWQAERCDLNQYDAMAAAIRAYLRSRAANGTGWQTACNALVAEVEKHMAEAVRRLA